MRTCHCRIAALLLIAVLSFAHFPAYASGHEFVNPCVLEYDYYYEDGERLIAIDMISENEITYFVVDVQISRADLFRVALSGDEVYGDLERLSEIASRHGAILAINGDDYGVHKFGTIIRNGEIIRANETTRHMLELNADGDMSVRLNRSNEDLEALASELLQSNVVQTFEFGPALVANGQPLEPDPNFDLISMSASRREPRTAIGQIGPLHYIIIVADGRRDGYSIGMTLTELQQLFVKYGAQTALNLDGGGSTTLWFDGEVINRPANDKERKISDMIFF